MSGQLKVRPALPALNNSRSLDGSRFCGRPCRDKITIILR